MWCWVIIFVVRTVNQDRDWGISGQFKMRIIPFIIPG